MLGIFCFLFLAAGFWGKTDAHSLCLCRSESSSFGALVTSDWSGGEDNRAPEDFSNVCFFQAVRARPFFRGFQHVPHADHQPLDCNHNANHGPHPRIQMTFPLEDESTFVSTHLTPSMASDGNTLQVPLRQKPRRKTQGFFAMSRRRVSCKDLGHADCQGWLYKKKEKGTFLSNKWKKFWVVLKGSSLYWYSSQMAEKADGFVNLPDFTVERANECKKKHAFKVSHPEIKTFYFAAENTPEMNVWLNKLGLAVIHQASAAQDEERYSESDQEDPEVAVETPPSPYSSEALSAPVAHQASSSSPKRSEASCSLSSRELAKKTSSSASSSSSKERQSWLNIVNSSSAAEDEGQPVMFAVQVHSPLPSEANSCKTQEDATSESGFLNSLSSDDTSSLSSNLDHLTVPDKPIGSKMTDREETKASEDDEMEKLYKSLEQASLSPLGDRRPSTKKELRKSFVKRCKNPSINEKLHKIRTLNSTLKCKEHDLAMINQLLDDPKLTARKYREWKVMNTLLIQDIYQQQRVMPVPEDSPQELEKQPSSACIESSI